MLARRIWRRVALSCLSGGTLLAAGCLATLERNIDLILSPAATENILRAPYSAVSTLVQLVARYVRGG
ncbi:MAG: hypothetical protein IPM13_02335 [Phycisphaerales bacterium]|nr:hypothetical protein [Phycisphaerales bacterium]